ncbi:hypothetical protein DCC39_18260 [Pueribacillus theae]|uniref:Uncharacterized protein n=1 Tax=Pueribacillus theae TaxID=2171751 RepID=A0A2U1JJD9_9BACI|nr:hypothetical protein [Pueribacillus theae]PWA05276.1 hypothetical protein DCC39_18260 [Pueribacillus theae]
MKDLTRVVLLSKTLDVMEAKGLKNMPIKAIRPLIDLLGKTVIENDVLQEIIIKKVGWTKDKMNAEVINAIIEREKEIREGREGNDVDVTMQELKEILG